jgi:putative isomerase
VLLTLAPAMLIMSNTLAEGPALVREPGVYPDLLDYSGAPTKPEDWGPMAFSDQGAWLGFGLPKAGDPAAGGGFTGPFLYASGRWASAQLLDLTLFDADSGLQIHPRDSEARVQAALPGLLTLATTLGGVEVSQELWFDQPEPFASGVALVRVRLHNPGPISRRLKPVWSNLEMPGAGVFSRTPDSILFVNEQGDRLSLLFDPPFQFETMGDGDGNAYQAFPGEPWELAPGAVITFSALVAAAVAGDPVPDARQLKHLLSGVEQSYRRNQERWRRWLDSVDTGQPADDPVQIVAVKSLQTLVGNWRGPAGRMSWPGMFPSSNIWYFNGYWAWDTWKQAVAVAIFDPQLAASMIRGMLDHQDETGMIADVVYLDPAEDNWRDSKPPLAAWAAEEVFNSTQNIDFISDIYPYLLKYHYFWYAYRDQDGDGLCEYGATDGTLEAARWESGMDNAVRFDETAMLQNSQSAWSMNQESVDLNSYLWYEKQVLARLAAELGREADQARFTAEAEILGEKIRRVFYDPDSGWFYDTDIESGAHIKVQGPEGWIPLWTGVASPEQAARVREGLLDPTRFRTHTPFPTVAANHPEFSEGYWRGLVWLDQAWFAIEGLRRYGYDADANSLTRQLFGNLQGATEAGQPIFENYNALTGAGRNARHFSWSAAHLLLLTRTYDAP